MDDQSLRDHVVRLLQGGKAYETFDEIVVAFTQETCSDVPEGAERSAWQVLEHMRIAQRDILDFCRNADGSYDKKRWPEDYWPKSKAPRGETGWSDTVAAFLQDRTSLERLVTDPASDLLAPFPWDTRYTLLREALLAADHNSYHLGQLSLVRRLLGADTP